jgi:hypothetical protein
MSPSEWDKELAKIDKRLESISDEQLFPSAKAVTPAEKAAVKEKQRETSTFGVFARLVLAVALGVGMLFWPYGHRCGIGLIGYIAASLVVAGAGVWTSIWTWRHRSARGHVLSLLLIVWGLLLAGQEILPRSGYAVSTAEHPSIWLCP